MLKEFKEFAMKGNVLDLAVGVIIGGAFGKIVTSLVNDMIIPFVGLLLGGVNFSDLELALGGKNGALLKYGAFIQSIVDFLIVAMAIFLFIKAINSFKKKKEEVVCVVKEEPKPTSEELLLMEIRDLLKARS